MIDTYEQPTPAPVVEDTLAEFREQAKQGPEQRKMSASAAATLRQINAVKEATRLANKKFANDFTLLDKDTWTIVQVFKRIYSADQNAWTTDITYDSDGCRLGVIPVRNAPLVSDALLERMATKVRWSLAHGWSVSEPHDVTSFGELTQEELAMADDRFYAHLESTWVWKSKAKTASKAAAKAPVTKVRPCKSGVLCLKAEWKGRKNPKATSAPAAPRSQFCSANCRQSLPVRLLMAQKALPTGSITKLTPLNG